MKRRTILGAMPGLLAAPAIGADLRSKTLRFMPQQALGWFDPSFWPFIATRTHAHLIFDTLYGVDTTGRSHPQMAEGHTVSGDGLTWRIRLREGLLFHDGSPVLAEDCVASIRRWGGHSEMGESLLEATLRLFAPDDRTIQFTLSRPFPLLPLALGDRTMQVCAIMPAWVVDRAEAEPRSLVIGSGPYRFLADEYEPWKRAAYARFERYEPRRSGEASFLAGPKRAHFERIEWVPPADPAAAAAGLRDGTLDWWEAPPAPSHSALSDMSGVALRIVDRCGAIGTLRMNHLHPPFSNPAVRRAVRQSIDQAAFMAAATGGSKHAVIRPAGFFCPGSALANEAGMIATGAPTDVEAARKAVKSAGQAGAAITVLAAGDLDETRGMGRMAAELLTRIGFAVQLDLVPVRGLVPRLLRSQPPGTGGWSAVVGYWPGHDMWHPGMHRYLRATGRHGEVGWPSSAALEAMRRSWLAATTSQAQRAIGIDMQVQAFEDLPYLPLGNWKAPTAHRADLVGMLDGFPLFWNLRRT